MKAPKTARKARKTPAKASGKGTAKKPATRRQEAPKVAPSKVKTLEVYLVDPSAPYGCFKSNDLKGAYTMAMLSLTGIAHYTKTGKVTPVRVKPETMARRVAVWGKYVQDTAYRHWRVTRSLIGMEGLTVAGVNESQERLAGTSKAFKTSVELTDKMVSLLTKGGTLEHKGNKYNFSIKKPVEV